MVVKLVTDSTANIDPVVCRELDITVISLTITFPDESFKELDVDHAYFYSKIDRTGIIPTASQPALGEIVAVFRRLVQQGDDVLAVFISSEMSGTYYAALQARQLVLQEQPDAGIMVIDSRTNCMPMGMPVIEAARYSQKDGASLAEAARLVEKLLKQVDFYFLPTTLTYLKKGGRIGGAAALVGSLLDIKPIMTVKDGKADIYKKVRTTRAAIDQLMAVLETTEKTRGLQQVIVHHINNRRDGEMLVVRIYERFGLKAELVPIGPTIGLHVGPGTIGVAFCTRE
jgi:DegV family protein with EDD domain